MSSRAWALVLLALATTPGCGDEDEPRRSERAARTAPDADPAPTAPLGSRLAILRAAVQGCAVLILDDHYEVPAEAGEPIDIKRFFAMIEIDAEKSGCLCRCEGEPCVTFFRGEGQIVASLRIHHGYRLSWNGWARQSYLTERSAFLLGTWLAARGVPGPLADAKEKKRRDLARGRPW